MIGRTIGHYRVLSKLGEGGMGVVYRAEDLTLGRTVALKFLPPDSIARDEDRARLVHEARAAAALLHPNICPVYEIAEAEGRTFIAMAHIEGRSLKDRIGEGALPLDEALSIARQIGDGLAAAHAKGIVHRDIKPANVMLTAEGRPMLMDFGLAKVSGATKLTRTGTTMGTVAYMSPEQVQGREADHRSDIWALGVVLYEMVSGRMPFGADYEAALLYSILNEDAPSLAKEGGDIPAGLDGIVAKALARDPARRYQKAEELVADLDALAKDREALPAGKAAPAKGLKRVWRRARPWQRAAVIAAAAVVISGIIVGSLALLAPKVERIDSIGVLPIEYRSEDPDKAFLAASLTDRLAVSLGSIGVNVISNRTMRRFEASAESLKEIGRKSKAKGLVEAELTVDGRRMVITAKLYSAQRDRVIWQNSYRRDLQDALIVMNEIAESIAREIKAKLTPEQRQILAGVGSSDPEAMEAYLRGIAELLGAKNRAAADLFQRAIEIDPAFAPANAGLADALSMLCVYGQAAPGEIATDALRAAEKAVQLDGRSAEAHGALALAKFLFEWNWSTADAEYKRALELNPSSIPVLKNYILYLAAALRTDEALDLAQRQCELDASSAYSISFLGWTYFYAKRYDDANATLRRHIAMEPKATLADVSRIFLATSLAAQGKFDEALAQCDTLETKYSGRFDGQTGFVYAVAGKREIARRELREYEKESAEAFVDPYGAAMVYAGLGDRDNAFACLRKSLQARSIQIMSMNSEPYFDSLRSDPRWWEILSRIGFPGAEADVKTAAQ